VVLAQRAENRRWLATQTHLGNVAPADRLRAVYGEMAQAALALRLVVGERGFRFEGETEAEQNQRHDNQIREAMGRVGDVGGLILVESSAEPVREAYTLVADTTRQYMAVDRHEPAGAERQKKLIALADAVSAKTDEVIQKARDHLDQLETPSPIQTSPRADSPAQQLGDRGPHGPRPGSQYVPNPPEHA
jgi:hypothetical protein